MKVRLKPKVNPLNLLLYSDPSLLILFTGIIAVAWGAFVWLPDAASFVCNIFKTQRQCFLWEVFDSSPTFELMAKIAPQWLWGGSLMFWGMIKLWALFYSDRYSVKIAANGAMFLVWSFVWVSVVRANPASTAALIYGLLCFCSFYCMVRRTIQWLGAVKNRSERYE